MSNKQNGNELERLFAKALAESGYWVHRLQDNANGQPFDIIAVRYNKAYAYECKDCKNDVFELNRIEENQRLAYKAWRKNCNDNYDYLNWSFFVAIRYSKLPGLIFTIPIFHILKWIDENRKTITLEEALSYAANYKDGCNIWKLGQY